jgi:hypothetical protein
MKCWGSGSHTIGRREYVRVANRRAAHLIRASDDAARTHYRHHTQGISAERTVKRRSQMTNDE